MTTNTRTTVRELTAKERRRYLEQEVRRWTDKKSVDEFIKAWRAGEYDDPDDNIDAYKVVMLLPFGEENSSGDAGQGVRRDP